MNDLVGTTQGQYEIIELIGEGGMANVYRAWQPSLQRYVALKVLAPHLSGDANFVARFHQEAVSAANLKHNNIVTIHDVGDQDGYHFIAMEFIEGGSLEDRIRSQGALPLEQVVDIIGQVGQALDYAHQRGFIHRDIKPANVLITPEGRAVLTDFGIAKAISDSGVTAPLTKAGSIFGSPHYMSPEQIKDEPIDRRTDLYSLGIVCYEMLDGQVPFDGATTHAILYAQAHNPPPPLNEANPNIPPAVEAVVNKMLSKTPEGRYDNAGAFATALAQAATAGQAQAADEATVVAQKPPSQAAVTIVSPSRQRVSQQPQQAHAPARRKKVALLGAIVGVVLVAGAIAALLLRGEEPAETKLETARETPAGGRIVEATETIRSVQQQDASNVEAITEQLEAAEKLVRAGQYDAAIAAYETVQKTRPTEVKALRGLGEVYEAKGEWKQAAGWYEKWSQVAPDDPEAQLRLGWAHFALQEYENAVANFDRSSRLRPDWSEGFEGLGRSYYEMQDYASAANPLMKWQELEPENPQVHELLAESLYALERYDEALPVASKWVELSPDESNAHRRLGWLWHRLGEYEDAVVQFQQAVNLPPASADVFWGLGSSLFRLERYDEALSAYEGWRELEPDNPLLYRSLGWLYYYQEEYDAAIDAFLHSLDLERHNDAYRGLEATYRKLEQTDDVIQVALEWTTFNSESAEAHTRLGWAYYRADSYKNAIEQFLDASELNPSLGDAYRGLGSSYVGLDDHQNAIAAYEKWAELQPDDPIAYRNIGWEYYSLRRYKQAIQAFEDSLLLENHPSAFFGLATSYRRLGDCTNAIPYYEKVLELDPEHAEAAAGLEACR